MAFTHLEQIIKVQRLLRQRVNVFITGNTLMTRDPNPFLDDQGVLRVGGRLKHALLLYDEKHPVIVPPDSWMTRLLIESCHCRTLHGGVQMTLGLLRLRFWVPRGRTVVKQQLHRCVTCTRWRAATPQPPMGNLPRDRVTPTRPFLSTGLDYAEPIFMRTSKGRGHRAQKGHIAVFICFWSKAIHLEVVSDYTSETFIAALRRFVSRRGLCTDIYSDCGTTFIGADRTLRELFKASTSESHHIARAANTQGIRWHFNPPAASHFGDLWEAAALSDDPDDTSALTPNHFLIGAPLLAVPEPSLTGQSASTLSR
ncbi:uncharacterized protein LOC114932289 [Nylanderia fulva]|uniref:uncharacterized protein LOC114932289 n=1 Tax=Nylanderia fulva TaxID=613905 RepID=UPI0010FAFF42|nr:uncharacterized protein LOC114932289 [Nylanderia fulva]